MDAEQNPTYHLIKDGILELLTWGGKGDRNAHTLSSYHGHGPRHSPHTASPSQHASPGCQVTMIHPLGATESQVTDPRTQSR